MHTYSRSDPTNPGVRTAQSGAREVHSDDKTRKREIDCIANLRRPIWIGPAQQDIKEGSGPVASRPRPPRAPPPATAPPRLAGLASHEEVGQKTRDAQSVRSFLFVVVCDTNRPSMQQAVPLTYFIEGLKHAQCLLRRSALLAGRTTPATATHARSAGRRTATRTVTRHLGASRTSHCATSQFASRRPVYVPPTTPTLPCERCCINGRFVCLAVGAAGASVWVQFRPRGPNLLS